MRYYHLTEDNFGAILPDNWEEIAGDFNAAMDEWIEDNRLDCEADEGEILNHASALFDRMCDNW